MGHDHEQTVFVVDDELTVCKAIERTLENLSINVFSFTSGEACLSALENQRCDVLITDVRMSPVGGLEILEKTKRMAPWMPVLMITGYGDIPTAVKAVQMGAADYIEKPLERDAFLTLVENHLGSARRWSRLIGKPLTKTETRILYFVLAGKSSKEIAVHVHRSLRTVELHRQHIMRKFGVENVVELVCAVTKMGLVLPTMIPEPPESS